MPGPVERAAEVLGRIVGCQPDDGIRRPASAAVMPLEILAASLGCFAEVQMLVFGAAWAETMPSRPIPATAETVRAATVMATMRISCRVRPISAPVSFALR